MPIEPTSSMRHLRGQQTSWSCLGAPCQKYSPPASNLSADAVVFLDNIWNNWNLDGCAGKRWTQLEKRPQVPVAKDCGTVLWPLIPIVDIVQALPRLVDQPVLAGRQIGCLRSSLQQLKKGVSLLPPLVKHHQRGTLRCEDPHENNLTTAIVAPSHP